MWQMKVNQLVHFVTYNVLRGGGRMYPDDFSKSKRNAQQFMSVSPAFLWTISVFHDHWMAFKGANAPSLAYITWITLVYCCNNSMHIHYWWSLTWGLNKITSVSGLWNRFDTKVPSAGTLHTHYILYIVCVQPAVWHSWCSSGALAQAIVSSNKMIGNVK